MSSVAAEYGLAPLIAHLLLQRVPSPEHAGRYLQARLADLPNPDDLPDMTAAVNRLVLALQRQEPIAIHGDYDVDGITGTTLLVEGLRSFGGRDIRHHIPLRLRDGYGLSSEALREAARQGVKVVVSVDCGVSAHEEAKLAREHGLSLIITDHHQPPPQLPEALAIINPKRADSMFSDPDLSGVGVAFFLLVGLRKSLREAGWFDDHPEPDLRSLLDLVALGTIADLVPLRGVNRTLTRFGLQLLQHGTRPGIKALKQLAGVVDVTAGSVGFQLAPRLNAAGRLDDAGLGVALLLEQDLARAMNTARLLEQCNRQRQELEQSTFVQAMSAVAKLSEEHTHAIVLAEQGWHPGVIGVVASRLVERFHRPTVMIALDGQRGKGSARSIRGYHLFQGLQSCADYLENYGGHEMAAGLSLVSDQVSGFAAALERHVRSTLEPEDLIPKLRYDGIVLLEDLNLDVVRQVMALAPFGMGNPEPVWLVENVTAKHVKILQQKHLRFSACRDGFGHPAIAFKMAERLSEFEGVVDLLFTPQVNRFRDRETVQLRVKGVRPSQENSRS